MEICIECHQTLALCEEAAMHISSKLACSIIPITRVPQNTYPVSTEQCTCEHALL